MQQYLRFMLVKVMSMGNNDDIKEMAKKLGISDENLAVGLKKDEKGTKDNIKKAYKLMGGD